MSKVFKDFFSNFVVFFLAKLPDPSNKYNLEFVFLYYSNFDIPEVFHSKSTSEEKVFKIMKKLPGKFLKDGAEILSKPISKICNLFISCRIFPNASKVSKFKLFSRKAKNSTHIITDLSRYCH